MEISVVVDPGPTSEEAALLEYEALALQLARRFRVAACDRPDLSQVARLGLLVAYRRYRPEHGSTFRAFATATILGHLKHHFRDDRWHVSVPRRVKEHRLRVRSAVEDLTSSHRRSPTIDEIAAHAGLRVDDVLLAIDADSMYRPASISHHGEDGDRDLEPATDERGFERLITAMALESAVARLSAAERRLLHLHFVEGMTQGEMGRALGVSQMTVSRRLRHLEDRLRAWLTFADAG